MRNILRIGRGRDALIETNTRKIVARLLRDGWLNLGGGKHEKYEHPERPDVMIIVPRHREQSPGVARSIARLAGSV